MVLVDSRVVVGGINYGLAAARRNFRGGEAVVLVQVVVLEPEVVNGGAFGHLLDEGGDVFFGRLCEYFGSAPLVLIARGLREDFEDFGLDVAAFGEERLEQFHGAQRIAHVLYGLQAFDIVEEPAAACKAEHAEFLDFE